MGGAAQRPGQVRRMLYAAVCGCVGPVPHSSHCCCWPVSKCCVVMVVRKCLRQGLHAVFLHGPAVCKEPPSQHHTCCCCSVCWSVGLPAAWRVWHVCSGSAGTAAAAAQPGAAEGARHALSGEWQLPGWTYPTCMCC
jgi:hypothetical protein